MRAASRNSRSDGPAAKQLIDRCPDVGLGHQRLTDKDRIDSGRFQPREFFVRPNPALADDETIRGNL